MTSSGISRVAVIGTGTIGASWAAFFLSRGLAVAASDPAPQAEAFLRRFVAAAWPALVSLGAAETIPEGHLSFHVEPEEAVAEAEFVQENAPSARRSNANCCAGSMLSCRRRRSSHRALRAC